MKRRVINTARALALITVGLFFTACPIIYVSHHDSFPAEKFEAALDRITALQADNPDRTGEACELNILVYDGDGGELVRISMPLAIVEWGVDVAQTSVELDEDADWEDEMNPLRHMTPEDLRKLGPGLLVQVDDAEEESHVLIWLE